MLQKIYIGMKYSFTPSCLTVFDEQKQKTWTANSWILPENVTGTVCYINKKHGWFRVEYTAFGKVLHECFFLLNPTGQRTKTNDRAKMPGEYKRRNANDNNSNSQPQGRSR